MNNQNTRSQRRRQNMRPQNGGGNFGMIAVIIIALLLFTNYQIYSGIIVPNPETTINVNVSGGNSTVTPSEDPMEKDIRENFVTVSALNSDTKCGNLVLVDKTHPFDFDASTTLFETEELKSIYSMKNDKYFVKNINVSMMPTAIEALNSLVSDFYDVSGHEDLIIVDAFRSYDDQKKVLDAKIALYGEEQGRLIATNPGYSEHHTGLAFDFSLYIDGIQQDYDGTGDYQWITDNCYKYGFVIRYPENKTDITGITYEPWHLRYVGKEHAYFMTKNGLCLEEYVELLSRYPLRSSRLVFTTDEGETYSVYSQSISGDTAEIYVPGNYEYTMSGDNDGRIIVSCKLPS